MKRACTLKVTATRKGWKVTLSGRTIRKTETCRSALFFVEGYLRREGIVEAWENGCLTMSWAVRF